MNIIDVIFKKARKSPKKKEKPSVINATELIAAGENPMHIIPLILANRKIDAD